MSFFIREEDGKLVFGGMKSIELNYEHVSGFGSLTIVDIDRKLNQIEDLWIIGSVVKTSYVKGKLNAPGLWTENEFAILAGENDVRILARLTDAYHLYRNSARVRYLLEDGKYSWNYGCTAKQIEDALVGVMPTRWLVEQHQIG